MVHKSNTHTSGGGGSGTVTEIDTGTGLTGGPVTTTGTISIANNTANTLAGFDNSGIFSDVTIGSGLLLSGGSLAATNSGSVTTTGSPATGNLTKFSGASSITNGDLSGDISTSGTLAATLATVNTNTGSFGSSTSIPNFTVNGKGLITAAGGNAVIAPAGTLTGTTLAAGVVTSSLTTVGTIGTGTWQGTIVAPAYGGTGTNNGANNLTVGASASVSGTNTGDKTITLTGGVTGSGTGSFAATVVTNANLTGPITSVGNATSIASQTGTGTKFVVDTSPALITPAIGVATGTGLILTGTSANIFAAGANGSTNPALQVDASTASSVTGIAIKSAASGNGVTLTALGGNNESITIQGKGGTGNTILNVSGGSTASIQLQNSGFTVVKVTQPAVAFTFGGSSTAAGARFSLTGAADTSLTASTEAPSTYFNLGQTRQHATGSLTLQRDFRITGTTHGFIGASTATDIATFSIDGYAQAGTNATITNASGILIPVQAVAGTVTNAYGINVVAPTGAGTLNQAALFTGDVGLTSGNLLVNTAGKGLSIKSGSNARIGTGTLTAGRVTIANTSVTANTRVFLTDTSSSTTNVGSLTVSAISAGTSFTVTSTLALDVSTFNWMLVESA